MCEEAVTEASSSGRLSVWKMEHVAVTGHAEGTRVEQFLTLTEDGMVFFAEYLPDPLSGDPIELRKCRMMMDEEQAHQIMEKIHCMVKDEDTDDAAGTWRVTFYSKCGNNIVKQGRLGGLSFYGEKDSFTKASISDYLKWMIPVRGLIGFGI